MCVCVCRGAEGAAAGSYPAELLLAAPAGLPSWDDVRVRYDYYKKRGYLRGKLAFCTTATMCTTFTDV